MYCFLTVLCSWVFVCGVVKVLVRCVCDVLCDVARPCVFYCVACFVCDVLCVGV